MKPAHQTDQSRKNLGQRGPRLGASALTSRTPRKLEGTWGAGQNLPKTSDAARIAGQAAALYEMLHPGTILKVVEGDPVAQEELGDFVQSAHEAFEANRLQILDGELAQGWVEVFPELTEEERLLGQLPGFTPERLDQFREEYPIEDLGLPIHTGHGAEEDPVGNIISTPISEEVGPNIVANERTPEELDALASDPARGGRVDEKGEREREIGLGAESSGLILGPIVRDPTGAAEFIGSDGQAWDVKGFRSDFAPAAGGFDLEVDVGKAEKELATGHNVIIDTGHLNQADLEALKLEIDRRGISDRVVYWP